MGDVSGIAAVLNPESLNEVANDAVSIVNTGVSVHTDALSIVNGLFQIAAAGTSIFAVTKKSNFVTSIAAAGVSELALYTSYLVFKRDAQNPNSSLLTISSDAAGLIGNFASFNSWGITAIFAASGNKAPAIATSILGVAGTSLGVAGLLINLNDESNGFPATSFIAAEKAGFLAAKAELSFLRLAAQSVGPALAADLKQVATAGETVIDQLMTTIDGSLAALHENAEIALSSMSNLLSDLGQMSSDLLNSANLTSATQAQQTGGLSVLAQSTQSSGYYLVQPGDTFASIVTLLTDSDIRTGTLDASTLMRLDAPFGITTLTPGEFIQVPIFPGTPEGPNTTQLFPDPLSTNEIYVFDPSSDTLFTVGADLAAAYGGGLVIDTPRVQGGFTIFAAGTYSSLAMEADGAIDVGLTSLSRDPLGTASFSAATGAGTLVLPDGTTVPLTGGPGGLVSDPPSTPEGVLLDELQGLGTSITAAQLDQDNSGYLDPSGAAYAVQGAVVANSNDTAATVTFTPDAPDATVAGQPDVDITYYDYTSGQTVTASVPAINVLAPLGDIDISRDAISGVQVLELGEVTLTAAQFASFSTIEGSGDITAASSGTFDLSAANVDPAAVVYSMTATDFGGTTLIGNGTPGQTLTASDLGNDTLVAGDGGGDTLLAGDGDDSLSGGAGGDTFELGGGVDTVRGAGAGDTFIADGPPGPGSSIVGTGGGDALEGEPLEDQSTVDITAVSVSGVASLDGDFTITVAQLESFSSITGSETIEDTAANIEAALPQLVQNAAVIDTIVATDTPVVVSVDQFATLGDIAFDFSGGLVLSDTAVAIVGDISSLAAAAAWVDLQAIVSTDTTITVTAATAATEADWPILQKMTEGFAISDTAADILAALPQLAAYLDLTEPTLVAITATDQTLAVTAEDVLAYEPALSLVSGGYRVADDAGSVAGILDDLEALVTGGDVLGITLTDASEPTLVITGAQRIADEAALAAISSPYRLDIVGEPSDPSDFEQTGASDILIENTAGAVVVGALDGAALSYETVAGLGPEWRFEGDGGYLNDGSAAFLIENTSGAVVVGEVVGGQVRYAQVASLGPEWSFVGSGDFLGVGYTQFLIENTAGAVVVGQVEGGQTQYAQVAALGPEWKFVGTGDFLGDGKDDFLIENGAGAVVVGEVSGGQTTYTAIGALGPEWKFVGSGDFLGDGMADFLIENTAGAVVVGEVNGGQATFTTVGALGPEWRFVGAGDYAGTGIESFVIENSSGAVFTGTVVSGVAQYAQVASLGPEWTFHG